MILIGENWSSWRKALYIVGGRWMNEYGAMVEWYWQGKTEVLGEKHYTGWVVDEWMSMEQWWNDTDRGKQKYWEGHQSQCHISTTNPTWIGLESNPETIWLHRGTRWTQNSWDSSVRIVTRRQSATAGTKFFVSSPEPSSPVCGTNRASYSVGVEGLFYRE